MTIVTFSGIDGAGKSTQILALEKWLRRSGFRTMLLTFWDDVAVLSKSREFMSYKAFKGDRGVGSPDRPVHRRDKNVTSFPLALARFCFYFADAVHLYLVVRRAKKSAGDVVIFDRYIYDELANLPLSRWPARAFTRLVLKLAPAPDVAFVIDADPVAAQARKPEYPLEFVRRNRDAYLEFSRLARNVTVLGPASIDALKETIKNEMVKRLAPNPLATRAELLSSTS